MTRRRQSSAGPAPLERGAGAAAGRPMTVGAELERRRAEVRARQLERVLAVLRRRREAADADGTERRGLHRAIREFEIELAQVRSRAPGRGSSASTAT